MDFSDKESSAATLKERGDAALINYQFQEAEHCFTQALEINRQIYPKNHPQIARALTDLGTLQRTLSQFREANQLLTEAWQINKNLYPDRSS